MQTSQGIFLRAKKLHMENWQGFVKEKQKKHTEKKNPKPGNSRIFFSKEEEEEEKKNQTKNYTQKPKEKPTKKTLKTVGQTGMEVKEKPPLVQTVLSQQKLCFLCKHRNTWFSFFLKKPNQTKKNLISTENWLLFV